MKQLSRETVEQTARIIGPQSAAARALLDADQHEGDVRFWKDGSVIVVEKLPACKASRGR